MCTPISGLDLAHLKITIRALAKFHAIGLSIKHKKPAYLSTLRKYTKPLNVDDVIMQPYLESTLDNLENDPETRPYVKRMKATGDLANISRTYYTSLEPEDPWACVVHGDLWNNNMLFHVDEAGHVDGVKLVDFQTYYMSSPLTDLVFFLCTTMRPPMIHFDDMLELYRQGVCQVLRELGCEVDLFSRECFEERLRKDAPGELFHVIMMSKVVELREDEQLDKSPLNEACLRRLRSIAEIFAEKRWI